jgi:hypothetical protein
VLTQPAEDVVAILRANPGNKADPDSGWHLIATGDRTRLGVISQTSYRIRTGGILAFADPGKGHYETLVSTDTSLPNRRAAVELYARYVK